MDYNIRVFDEFTHEYDEWFDENRSAYESEISALRKFVPKKGKGMEIGVGTGRFAVPLGIKTGIEPARAMADIARNRGIKVYEAVAERLPFKDDVFDFVLLVTTICFLRDPVRALREARRVLRSNGKIIIGMIDKDSPLGKIYESRKERSRFYRHARFFTVTEVLDWLSSLQFDRFGICQTIFNGPDEITDIEPVKEGYGGGGFVVIRARKFQGRTAQNQSCRTDRLNPMQKCGCSAASPTKNRRSKTKTTK
jgi:SAM-dependent methyltransferase